MRKMLFPVLAALLWLPVFLPQAAAQSPSWEAGYHSVVPLGEDVLLLMPAKRLLVFRASAESPRSQAPLDDSTGYHPARAADAGQRRWPDTALLRLTVSSRAERPPALDPLVLDCGRDCDDSPNDYLLHLRFQAKVFHGLHVTVLPPATLRLIGVPADVPADERVYRMSFELGDVPPEDGVVVEVLSPSGQRLTKFHFDPQ